MSGLVAVQNRISALQAQLGALTPARVMTTSTAFGAALAKADAGTKVAAASRAAGPATADGVIAAAKRYLGVPYLWGGTDPAKGLDCSGFVQRVFKDVGIDLPRVSRDQAEAGQPVPDLAHARPGDLVSFDSPVDHIGIYLGNGQMIVSPHTGDVVKIAPVGKPTKITRVLPDDLPSGGGLESLFAAAGNRHGVSASLLSAVARAESGYDPTATSPAGAIGLMQIMPGTAKGLGIDPRDPAQAVDGAARLLRGYLDRYGSTELALAAYNAGPGAVARYGGVPPYAETQQYVKRVLDFQKEPA